MNPDTFLSYVVPNHGNIVTATKHGSNGRFSHTAHSNTLEAGALITRKSAAGEDTYFAVASFNDWYTDPGGRKRLRTQQNVAGIKSWYVDIDVGKGKEYPDVATALTDLVRVSTHFNCSPSIIVRSGNGLHAYWVCAAEVPVQTWNQVAAGIVSAFLSQQLKFDKMCTTDVARILRTPGSLNYKEPSDPKAVVLLFPQDENVRTHELEVMEQVFTKWATVKPLHGSKVAGPNAELAGGMRSHEPADMGRIVSRCPQFGELHATGGATAGYDMWWGMMTVLRHCSDPTSWIEPLAGKHPTYNYDANVEKLEDAAAQEHGAGLCDRFRMLNPAPCGSCKHAGKVRSPIALGYEDEPTEMPFGWKAVDGITYRGIKDDNGNVEWVIALDFVVSDVEVMFVPAIGVDVVGEWRVMFKQAYPNQTPRTYEIPIPALSELRAFRTQVAHQGLIAQDHKTKTLRELMVSWTEQLRSADEFTTTINQCGWVEGPRRGFAVGDTVYWSDGTEELSTAIQLASAMAPAGTLRGWKDAADLIVSSGSIALHIALASAFAAPLVLLSGIEGMTLNLTSNNTGVGKTAALRTAQAVWGNPKSLMAKVNDTEKSIAMKIAMLRNLPVYWDEIHLAGDGAAFLKLAYQLGQGADQSRLTRNAELREGGGWTTMLIAGSNMSLQELASSKSASAGAGVARIIEVYSGPLTGHAGAAAQMTFAKLRLHHSHAGRIYAKYLVTHHDELEKEVQGLMAELAALPGVAGDTDRFNVAGIAVLVVGARVASKLGLVQLDVGGILRSLVSSMVTQAAVTVEELTPQQSGLQVVQEYMSSNTHQRLVTSSINRDAGRRHPNDHRVVEIPHTGVVAYQMSIEGDILIPVMQFRRWLQRRKEMWPVVSMQLKSVLGVDTRARVTIAAGTTLSTGGRQLCIYIPAGTMDDEEVTAPTSSVNSEISSSRSRP